MNRRECLKLGSVAAVAPFAQFAMYSASAQMPAKIVCSLRRLNLRHTWTTTMSSSEYRDTVQLTYKRDGIEGFGEGAPIIRYKEFPASAQQAIESITGKLADGDPFAYRKMLADVRRALGPGQHAAMAAVDIAVFD